jgi:hypothetical protein
MIYIFYSNYNTKKNFWQKITTKVVSIFLFFTDLTVFLQYKRAFTLR